MRLPDQRTPVGTVELARAYRAAWLEPEPPSASTLALLLAQWALETGWGRACHHFNLGNAKATPDWPGDVCFFPCNEVLSAAGAAGAIERAGTRTDEDDGPDAEVTEWLPGGRAVVWFYPDNPACCFRAFATLQEGAADHLQLLRRRFAAAWPALLRGDAATFCQQLKAQRYYTADLVSYQSAVVSLQRQLVRQLEGVDLDEPPRTDLPPVINPDAVLGLVWQTGMESIRATDFRRDDEDS